MESIHEESGEYETMTMEVMHGQKEGKEPLLGLSAEIPQPEDRPLYYNLVSGTAILAQAGAWALVVLTWGATFIAGLTFFSWHILLNTTSLLLTTQATLLLQPTHTPLQKRQGTKLHFLLNTGSLSTLLLGLAVIELNRVAHHAPHLQSPHAYLGALTYALLLLQGVVGFTQYYAPVAVYGSVERARGVWKYHRMGGYFTLVVACGAVAAAARTRFNTEALRVPVWLVLVVLFCMLAGIFSRVRLFKFGFGKK